MKRGVIVLSGKVCSGKSTLAREVARRFGVLVFTKDQLLAERLREINVRQNSRTEAELESATAGSWLKEALGRLMVLGEREQSSLFLVDGADTPQQVRALRDLGPRVLHVHLAAPVDVLRARYSRASSPKKTFEARIRRWSKATEEEFVRDADVVIDTERCRTEDVFERVRARLELNPLAASPCIDVLIGGQYGSEGKGNIAQYLAGEYDVLVRVGGPNAGHKVYRHNDVPYTFRQLPSGFLGNQRAMLVLGAGAVIGLDTLRKEIGELQITPDNLIIDPRPVRDPGDCSLSGPVDVV